MSGENIHHDQSGGDHSPKALAIVADVGKTIGVVAFCAAIAVVCMCVSVYVVIRFQELHAQYIAQADRNEREVRMAEYYINELELTLAGLKIERPEGGYESFKRKKE